MKSMTKLCFALVLSVLLFSYSCANYTPGDNGNPKGRPDIALTYPELVSMLKHYDETRKKPLATARGDEDTRVNFLKIEDLKQYIAYVEKEAKKKKIKVTGINFISAAYPNNYSEQEKQNYQTIIMMPATTIDGKEGVSFDPLKSDNRKPKSLKEILSSDYNYNWYYDLITINKSKSTRSRSVQKSGGGDLSSGGNKMGTTPPMGNGNN